MPDEQENTETEDAAAEKLLATWVDSDSDDPADGPDPPPEGDPADEPEDWRKNFDADKASKRISKLQSESKNLRERAKAAEEKAAGVGDKDKQITDLQSRVLKYEVANELGLPKELVSRLSGSTKEELLGDAKELVSLFSQSKPGAKPTERLRGGGDPTEEPEEDIAKVVADIPRN